MKNYYQILEIGENASPEIIEKAYRVLAKKYHPDVQPRDKLYWAEVNFREISEAYQVLSNKELKREYDMKLNAYNFQKQNYNYSQFIQQPNYNNSRSESQNEEQQKSSSKLNKSKSKKEKSAIKSLNREISTSLKEIVSNIPTLISDELKKPKGERSKDLKALALTIIIVSIIIFIFIKVPFLNKLIFP